MHFVKENNFSSRSHPIQQLFQFEECLQPILESWTIVMALLAKRQAKVL